MIRETISFLKDILYLLPTHIYWKDDKGRYQWCNNAHLVSLGLKVIDDIFGKTDFDLVWKNQAADLIAIDKMVMETGKEYEGEETVTLFNGETAVFLSKKIPLKKKLGKAVGILGVSVDITERKKSEEELRISKEKAEAANRAKSEFLENMRHDIRTPLTGIVGLASLIKEEAQNEKVNEYADDLVVASDALLAFMNGILETIKFETDEAFILRNKFELKKLLQSVIDLNKAKATEKKLTLALSYDDRIPLYVMGDSRKIHRIIYELVTNALNFTNQGRVTVVVTLENNDTKNKEIIIKFIVEDTGIGIPKEKIGDIFTQFSRVHPAYEGKYKGLGLGLTNVKNFVDALEGEIYVRSELKKGSQFTCLIPLKKPLINDDCGVLYC